MKNKKWNIEKLLLNLINHQINMKKWQKKLLKKLSMRLKLSNQFLYVICLMIEKF